MVSQFIDSGQLRETEQRYAFSLFAHVADRKGQRVSLAKIVELIGEGKPLKAHTDSVRKAKHGSPTEREIKKVGAGVYWGGSFGNVRREAGQDTSDWQGSGLVFVDVDPKDKRQAGATDGYGLLERFRGNPHVLLAYPSVSGTGCHVIYRVEPIPSYTEYRYAWAACKGDAEYAIEADINDVDNTKEANRLAFLAHYPEIEGMVNLSATPLPWAAPAAPVEVEVGPTRGAPEGEVPIDAWVALINGAGYDYKAYNDWTVVGLALRHSADDGELGEVAGFKIWEAWSSQEGGEFWVGDYDPMGKWVDYGKGERQGRDRITAATIVYRAKQLRYAGEYPRGNIEPPFEATGSRIRLDKAGVEVALGYLGIQVRINERAHSFEFATEDAWLLSQLSKRGNPGEWLVLEDIADASIRAAIEKSFTSQENKPARFGKERWFDCLRAYCAGARQVDPLEDWLKALPQWDREERIDGLLVNLLKAADTPLNRFVSGAILCGAIARTYEPGCTHDWIPVLIGEQGVGKSSFIRGLIPKERQAAWYSDGAELDNTRKELFESIQGAVLVEFSELKGVHHTRIEMLKAAISRSVDRLRLPYGTTATTVARRWVGIGTANDDGTGILPGDPSGNRRFVAVKVMATKEDAKDIRDYLDKYREQLWAEALARYTQAEGDEAKAALHLVGRYAQEADKVNRNYERVNQGMAGDAEWLTQEFSGSAEGARGLELADMLVEVGLFESPAAAKKDKSMQTLLSLELTRLGWTKRQKRESGSRVMLWSPPGDSEVAEVGVVEPERETVEELSEHGRAIRPCGGTCGQGFQRGTMRFINGEYFCKMCAEWR